MKQPITIILGNITNSLNDLYNQQMLVISSFVVLLSCLLFLPFGLGTHSEHGSAGNTALMPPSTKWWVKSTITSSSTSLRISATTDPAQGSAIGCPTSSLSPLRPGIYAYISLTPALPNRIRSGAGKINPYLGQIQPSASIKVIDGPLCADGFSWWLVEAVEGGLRGWSATDSNSEQWILPCPNPTVVCKTTPAISQAALTTDPSSTQNNNKDTCNSETLSIGMLTQVEQENLLVIRSEPYIGSVLGHAGPMSVVKIIDGPDCAGGAVWWEVNVAALNLTGWVIEANLRACSKEDGCT